MICVSSFFLPSGCSAPKEIKIEPPKEALFCDIEEPRRFTQEEFDIRAARWPRNLRRDLKTNRAWDREGCAEREAQS